MAGFLHNLESKVMGHLDGSSASGLTPWGQHPAYAFKNLGTGMYLAAHKDGELVAEDDTTTHHDLVWKVYTHGNGSVVLQSCHGTYLQVGPDGNPNSTGSDPSNPAAQWHLEAGHHGHQGHALRSTAGTWLGAVPPVEGQQAVFLVGQGGSHQEHWHVEGIAAGTALLDRIEGAVF